MTKIQTFTLAIIDGLPPFEGQPDLSAVPGIVIRWGYISGTEIATETGRSADYWVEFETDRAEDTQQ